MFVDNFDSAANFCGDIFAGTFFFLADCKKTLQKSQKLEPAKI